MIHLERVPTNVCAGRDRYEDEVYQERMKMKREGRSGIVETREGVASFSGNVTCPLCKRWLKASKTARQNMMKFDRPITLRNFERMFKP